LPIIQFAVSCLLTLAIWTFGTAQQSLSALAGGMVVWMNWHFLSWSWWRILTKKSFALGVSVIVLKYAILGLALIVLARQPWLQPIPFVLGIGSLVPTALIYAHLRKIGS